MAGRFSIEAIFGAKDYATRIMERIQRRAQRMAGSFEQFSKINDRLVGSLNNLSMKAAKASLAIGAIGVTAGLANVITTATDYEQAITNVGAVSLMTRDQIADLDAKAQELGRTTKFTATEAANAMEMMGKAGFTNAQIINGIDGVLSAAAAEGIGLEETASHVSNVLKGMGLDNEQMGQNAVRVANVLALASARTNSSIASLGESMANVSSTARQLNIPLEDVVSAVAMLQDVGLDASVSGSALNTMLTQMAAPSDKVAATMQNWGIKFKDAHGNMLHFEEVLAQLSKAAKKSGGNFDQVAFFAELVGLRGQKAAANLKDLFNSGKYQGLTKELKDFVNDAVGPAEKMSRIRMDTLRGDVTLLGSAFDLVKIASFDAAGKGLRPLVKEATNWLNVNKDVIASKANKYIHDFADALPTVLNYAGKVGKFAGAFSALSLAVKGTTWAIGGLKLIMSEGFWAKNGLTIGIYAAITAISLMIAYWPELKKFWEDHKILIKIVGLALGTFIAAWKVEQIQRFCTGAIGALKSLSTNGISALDPLHQKLIAMTAAIAAIEAAKDQNEKLKKETEGWGFMNVIFGMIEKGTWDPAKAVSAYQDDLAKMRAGEARNAELARAERILRGEEPADPLQLISPQEAAGTYLGDQLEESSSVNGEIVIRDETGRATMTSKPRGPINLRLKPSGGF